MLGTLRRSILRLFQFGDPEVQLRAALRKAGKAVAVSEGKETAFYRATTAKQLQIKRGIKTRLADDGQGGQVLLMMDNGGSITGIQCRCPKGFTGGCIATVSSDSLGDVAICDGLGDPPCTHPQISATSACGFFTVEIELPAATAHKLFVGQ